MTNNSKAFPCIMACVIKAVATYPDLLRMSIAAPGNDFRLGAMEAPPSIISTYLGEALTSFRARTCHSPLLSARISRACTEAACTASHAQRQRAHRGSDLSRSMRASRSRWCEGR
jgi:hypothetical protein